MPNRFAVYVPQSGLRNLDVGIDRRVWGWPDEFLDRVHRELGTPLRATAKQMRPGDLLVIGALGGQRRHTDDEFIAAGMGRVEVVRVSTALLEGQNAQVWRDGVYPNRVEIEPLQSMGQCGVDQLGAETLLALRQSFQRYGAPIRIGSRFLPFELSEIENAEDDDLDIHGDTDAYGAAVRRREQARWRRRLLGGRTSAECHLCARSMPSGYLRAAHIKRRADSSEEERHMRANVMLACVLGCDEMFERGAIYIDAEGLIRSAHGLPVALAQVAQTLDGRQAQVVQAALEFAADHRRHHEVGE